MIGPCTVPVSCEICLSTLCMSTDITKVKNGKKMEKLDFSNGGDLFETFKKLLEEPSECISGQCTPCMGLKPGDLVTFELEIGMKIEECNSKIDAMASFKIYMTPKICMGSTLGDVLEK